MTDWIAAIEGTEAGHRAAMLLALTSALAHALFGALQKGRYDPWLMRGAIDLSYGLMALPIALFVFPLPDARLWLVLVGVFVIHAGYKLLMAMAYTRAAYTVVYPVVRGTAPVITVLADGLVFQEHFNATQWAGTALVSLAIFALAAVNLRAATVGRSTLWAALGLAVLTGVFTTFYTVYDAWGIRLADNAFTFLAWFFVVDGLFLFPWIALARWRAMPERPAPGPLMARGLLGGLLGFVSFGAVMLATRLDKVGEAAVLRETSTVFAAAIGWIFLRETVGPVRALLMALIAAGAVLVELGG
ncbi:DMT family transporter [Roseobacter sp. HKCCA0434]|uniref:DMT family transporter n=1 Tax=Roseobacter sp. HKCCA0434 TaxID=3079297 RepID=UPI002905B789|nr:DMT family transporter [Roseobacter sp. HKCCA0434]